MKNVVIAFNMSFTTGRDETVGVLKYIRGRSDWNLHIINRHELPVYLREHDASEIDGLICSCVLDDNTLDLLSKARFPSVLLEVPRELLPSWSAGVSLLKSDNHEVGKVGAEHFLSLGRFASYAFVKTDLPYEWANERAQAFKAQLAKANIKAKTYPPRTSVRVAEASDSLRLWLERLPKPAAIMAACDERAVNILECCKRSSIRVPEQLSLLGVDNDELYCEHMQPTISSIQLNCMEQGLIAARELDQMMRSCKIRKRVRLVEVPPLKLVERDSTRPTKPSVSLVERAMSFIRENATNGIKVPDVSSYLGISRRLADKRFREVTGDTIANCILQHKLQAVERLLKSGERSPRKIAAQCGFANIKYLQRLFSRIHGMTMRNWVTGQE